MDTQLSPHLSLPIILDPTELYTPAPEYQVIATEVEWLQCFGVIDAPCWVKGVQLCEWSKAWLQVRGRSHQVQEIKQIPFQTLAGLFHPIPLPADWSDRQLLDLAEQLGGYASTDPIAHCLAAITHSDLHLWLGSPSLQHLASWLTIAVPAPYGILETVWQSRFSAHILAPYYQTTNKQLLLRQWLGIADPALTNLGSYPQPIPADLLHEFDQYWQTRFYHSAAKILDDLILEQQSGKERIVAQAYAVLNQHPTWCTPVREQKLALYLTHQQRQELRDRQPPQHPAPLAIAATPETSLNWVTTEYLPFRRWEVIVQQTPQSQCQSSQLAESFVAWMLHHYPGLTSVPVRQSCLNYSVFSKIETLCQSNPVLWVVVDGLGWLDHIELLAYLQEHTITLTSKIEPRFSVLPTLTGYAKWSLYSQLLPSDATWIEDAGKGFPKTALGQRYSDRQKPDLLDDLRAGKHRLYCWDTVTFDKCCHEAGDWRYFYKTDRPNALKQLANEIRAMVDEFAEPDQLRVVIASDHGQLLGESIYIPCPATLTQKGRTALGKIDDFRFVVLERDRYALPHDLSIIRGSESFGGFSHKTNNTLIGSHGGLFPEEVIVGVSVLQKAVMRSSYSTANSGVADQKYELSF